MLKLFSTRSQNSSVEAAADLQKQAEAWISGDRGFRSIKSVNLTLLARGHRVEGVLTVTY